jgi:hypothetical protein
MIPNEVKIEKVGAISLLYSVNSHANLDSHTSDHCCQSKQFSHVRVRT